MNTSKFDVPKCKLPEFSFNFQFPYFTFDFYIWFLVCTSSNLVRILRISCLNSVILSWICDLWICNCSNVGLMLMLYSSFPISNFSLVWATIDGGEQFGQARKAELSTVVCPLRSSVVNFYWFPLYLSSSYPILMFWFCSNLCPISVGCVEF